jgi:hypothetical protein
MSLSNLDSVAFWMSLNPFEYLSLISLLGFIWGLQAAFGANTGFRRNLEWQTGFILSLLTSGLLVSLLYSMRPVDAAKSGQIATPKWLRFLAKFPLIVVSGLSILLALIMLVNSGLAPIVVLNTNWAIYTAIGGILGIAAIICFACLGGYFGKSWFDKAQASEPAVPSTFTPGTGRRSAENAIS